MRASTCATDPRGRVLAACVVAAVAAALAGCPRTASTKGYVGLNADIDSHLARVGLGPGDVFEVRVYGEKELSGVYQVSPTGEIDYPLVGRLAADGLNPGQIAELIRTRLMAGYVREPSVSVFVQQYNSKKIFVLGQVAKPGTFAYTPGMNVVEAITLAGGFGGAANADYVVVTRRKGGGEQRIPVPVGKIAEGEAPNMVLQAGDIIFVPDKLL